MNAEVTPIKTAAETALADAFLRRQAALPGGREIAGLREAAFRRFERSGLPHRRVEEWKYTDLRALMREGKPLAQAPDASAKAAAKSAGAILAGLKAHRIIIVDGCFAPELSATAISGVTVTPFATAVANGEDEFLNSDNSDTVLALNTALATDGAVIRVKSGTVVDRPIQLVFVHSAGNATAVFARSHVVVEPGATVTLVESHEGPDKLDYQINTALDLEVGRGAKVDHIKVTCEGDAALHLATLNARVSEAAELRDFTFTLGGAVVRNQLFVTCKGKRAQLSLAGASLLRGRQHADTTLMLDHAVGGSSSRELFKSVLDDESHGVFQGKIVVRPDAQKTDARMMSRALLLSPNAEADNKPELEIFADDVQCGHGATAGALDESLKFYLMARGIPEREAEALLIQSFVGEAIETISHEGVRADLMFAAVRWLRARSA
ncbi:MAG: Fe-S cluster assembly protein SufD [Xanthobacteraceae bacterium]|nr:Fe-S cluster assembly protein SufD [Xanthobacteraceae bacterium]